MEVNSEFTLSRTIGQFGYSVVLKYCISTCQKVIQPKRTTSPCGYIIKQLLQFNWSIKSGQRVH